MGVFYQRAPPPPPPTKGNCFRTAQWAGGFCTADRRRLMARVSFIEYRLRVKVHIWVKDTSGDL